MDKLLWGYVEGKEAKKLDGKLAFFEGREVLAYKLLTEKDSIIYLVYDQSLFERDAHSVTLTTEPYLTFID